MKHISSIKPTIEKGLYSLVKRPDAKAPQLTEVASVIKTFQDEPNKIFLGKLSNRVPKNNSYKILSKNDFGLSKRSHSGSLTKVQNADNSAKIVDSRFKDSKGFALSKGVPALNKELQKRSAHKTDYNYTDPQFYEYKLKGKTIKDMQLSAFQAQGENVDPDTLDATARYQKWREKDKEESLNKNASKIQKLVRGRSVRENLAEGTRALDKFDEDDIRAPDANVKDVIRVGKASRKDKHENAQEVKQLTRDAQQKLKELEQLYNEERQFYADVDKLNKKQREEKAKVEKRIQFLEESGIGEYAKKGQETKYRKREAKEKLENEKALKIQKLYRGAKSRTKNDKYSDDNVRRFITPNPDYDPKNPFDNPHLYHKPLMTPTEYKAVQYTQARDKSNRRISSIKRNKDDPHHIFDDDAEFIDFEKRRPPKVPFRERLEKAYPERKEPLKPLAAPQDSKKEAIREAWEKKDDEMKAKKASEANAHQEEIQHIQTLDSLVSQYDELMNLLQKSTKGNTKTKGRMNELIANVYHGFGKNAGSNTNRKVATVLKQLESWEKAKEEKIAKIEELKAKQSVKFQKKDIKKQAKKVEEVKARLPKSTYKSNNPVTLKAIQAVKEREKQEKANKSKRSIYDYYDDDAKEEHIISNGGGGGGRSK